MVGMLRFRPQDAILEPCGGGGAFVDKILEKNPNSSIDVFELNPASVSILRQKYVNKRNVFIKETDTLLDETIISCSKRYDKIIGNPPYGARCDNSKKTKLSRIYNHLYTKESYTLFIYACTRCLNENGELCFIVPDTFLSLHRHLALRQYLLNNTKIKEIALFPSSFFPGINFGYANLCIITLVKCSNIAENHGNIIRLRTDFRHVSELGRLDCGKTTSKVQKEVLTAMDSAFMFRSTNELSNLINDETITRIGDIASCVTGFYSGNDKKYLHPINHLIKNSKNYNCVKDECIKYGRLTIQEQVNGIASQQCFVPIMKGGNIEFCKPTVWFMDWSLQAIKEYRTSKKCRFQNASFYFKDGIGIPMIRSSKLTAAMIEGRLFDQSIVGVFPHDPSWTMYLLAFFNSDICTKLIDAINPSANNSANYIKKIPFIVPSRGIRAKVESLVKMIIFSLQHGISNITSYKEEINNIFSCLYLNENDFANKAIGRKQPKVRQLNIFDSNALTR